MNPICYSASSEVLSVNSGTANLTLESTLEGLSLYDVQVELHQMGIVIAQLFESNPLIPGVILIESGELIGMISRRRFLERLSRPYGRELFLKRSIRSLHRFAQSELLLLSGNTLIVEGARLAVGRSPEVLYEPIIVQLAPQTYRLLDIQQLLVAQSSIHELTTVLLRQQTQSQLIQTEKLASLGQMVAGVAHEIRNPVSCILGNSSCLNNYYKDLMQLFRLYEGEETNPNLTVEDFKAQIDFNFLQEDLFEAIESIQTSADRLNQLVSSLHNFSHMDGSQRRETNLHQCIDSTLLILKNRLKNRIEVIKNFGNLPLISCYSGQLSQVFMNLLANAIDALEDKQYEPNDSPKIWIESNIKKHQNVDFPVSEFSSPASYSFSWPVSLSSPQHQGDWVSIRIKDNGCGIPKPIQQRIFDSFFTTKPMGKGTGLGLAISHQIVTEKHGGYLTFTSTEGIGTVFEILLPLL